MTNLKNKLLQLDLVIDNEYLTKYLNLLNTLIVADGPIEVHHIVPECYYTLHGKAIDNSPTNLVSLTVFNHLLAHYYLFHCVKDLRLKSKLAYAFNAMKDGQQGKLLSLTEKEFIEQLPNYVELRNTSYWKNKKRSEENIEAIRQAQYRRTPEVQAKMTAALTGKKRTAEQRKRMSEAQKNRDKSTFARGFTVPQERRDKISKSLTGKKQSDITKQKRKESLHKLKWYNNGLKSIRSETCPEGYSPGRLAFMTAETKLKCSQKGRHWYTNGLINTMANECPKGFWPGRTQELKERVLHLGDE